MASRRRLSQRIAVLGKFGKVTAVEGAQFARLQIDAIDLARAFIQREEAFRAGGELRHARAQRGEHAPRHLRGVELLEAALTGGRGNVIEFAAQSGKVLNAEIDEFHIAGLQRLHAQKAFGAEAQKGLVRIGRGAGTSPVYSAKAPARWLYKSAPCPASSAATTPSGSR